MKTPLRIYAETYVKHLFEFFEVDAYWIRQHIIELYLTDKISEAQKDECILVLDEMEGEIR